MKFHTVDGFNVKGSVTLPYDSSRIVAMAIAPTSEVDSCIVGGRVMGPMAIVPYDTTVQATRGFRMTADSTAIDPIQMNGRLDLVLFESCDSLVPPGPRFGVTRDAWIPGGSVGATAATATRIIRLPFQGRRMASFTVRRITPLAAVDFNIVVRGVKYLPRDVLLKLPTIALASSPFFDEVVDTYFGGAGASPKSVITGGTDYPNTGEQLETATGLGRTIYVGGGGDQQEDYDEMELIVYGAGGGDIIARGRAYGESVL